MSTTDTAPLTRSLEGADLPVAGTYALDASHTEVGFSVRHLMVAKTKGRFAGVSGTVVVAEDPSPTLPGIFPTS
jgi:polyisoprenoid-binding protein YceI